MALDRLKLTTGVALLLVGAQVAHGDPDPSIPGSYELTGTQDGAATTVKLEVGATGSVRREVTAGGITRSYSATGAFNGKTMSVSFPTGAPSGQPDPSNLAGAWTLRGANQSVGSFTGSGTFSKNPDGTWGASFRYTYRSGDSGTGSLQRMVLSSGYLAGYRVRTTGLVAGGNLIDRPVGRTINANYRLSADGKTLTGRNGTWVETFTRSSVPIGSSTSQPIVGTYTFGTTGVTGSLTNPRRVDGWLSASESGAKKTTPPVAGVRIVSPADGAVLVGQVLSVVVEPATADFEVQSGPARKALSGKLQVTGAGDVTIVAKQGDKVSAPVRLKAVTCEVVEVSVVGGQAIKDAPAPNLKRTLGSQDKPVLQPACILLGEKLTLSVKLAAQSDLAGPARVTVKGTSGSLKLSGTADLQALKAGQAVTVVSEAALNDKISINKPDISWTIENENGAAPLTPVSSLRIYTSFKAPVRNGPYYGESNVELMTKSHLELVCSWGEGTSKNIGNGDDSIGWKIDNYCRHHVHPRDFKPGKEPFAPAYAAGSKPPLNYDLIDDASIVKSTGVRPVGQFFYPPLGDSSMPITNPAAEEYSHFASNYGWWTLDNPTHTGGRCNQQAALICDLMGTVGIKANVHYLQRVGSGKRTGRPVRQYFNSSQGGMYWNFHGLARAQLADGSYWLYDGSFSWAPNRKNGRQEWAEAPGRWLNQSTPFIYEFGPWYYEDYMGGAVPGNDIPTSHVDGGDPGPGEYSGVPKAATEDLDWYNKRPH